MFTKALAPFVNVRTRAKGLQYFSSGRVIDITGAEWVANAVVRGTRDYRVELVRDRNRFTGSCECPYYADRAEICKHIWAALLEAEDRQLLGGDGPVGDDAVLDPEYRPSAGGRARAGRNRLLGFRRPDRRRQGAARGSASSTNSGRTWRRPKAPCPCPGFRTARSSTRSTSARRSQDGAPWSACSSVSGGRAVRGPSQSPSASPRLEAEHMVDRDDREILSLLIGASNAWYQSARVRSRLSSSVPLRSERTARRSGAADAGPHRACASRQHQRRPGAASDFTGMTAPPWRFDLDVRTDEKDDTILIDGAFVREGERMPLREPVLLLSRGFLFTRTTMARLELEGGFAWLARLRSFGPIAIPRIGSRRAARNARPVRPRSAGRCPGELRYDVVDGDAAAARSASAGPSGRTHTRCVRICGPRSSSITTAIMVEGPPGATAYDAGAATAGAAQPERRAGGHRSAAPARVPLHVEPFRVAANPRHLARAVPARRPHARERGLARRGGRPGVPVRGRHAAGGVVGDRLVRSARRRSISATAGRRPSRSCSPRSPAAKTSSCSTTEASGCCRRSGCAVTRRSPGSERPRVTRSGSGDRRPRCSTRCWRRSRRSRTTRRSRACAPSCRRSAAFSAADRAAVVPRARCASISARRSAGSSSCAGFSFGGCLADDMGLGKTVMVLALLDARRHDAPAGRTRPVTRRRAAIAGVQLDGGGGAVRAEAEGPRLHRTAARSRGDPATRISC